MNDEPRDATLEGLLDLLRQVTRDDLRVALPGRVTAYDAATQRASVQPLIKHANLDETEQRVAKLLPEVHSVPVQFPGGGGMRITWPLAKGDTVLLVFASSSIARWKRTGGEVDPGDDRRHDLNDAIAIPGLHDFAHIPSTAPTDAIVTHGDTRLGDPNATDDKYKVAIRATLDKFMDVLSGVTDTAGACEALHAALETANWPGAFVATKVRAK